MSQPPEPDELRMIARQAMLARAFEPDVPPAAAAQLAALAGPARPQGSAARDQRDLLWCSIDNDDSLDLDQLTVCGAPAPDGSVNVLVAIADVDALVGIHTPLDHHAATNTTSVYTSVQVFPMFPPRLSTDLTSLGADEDRLAVVVEMTIGADGALLRSTVYASYVRNRAKLAYSGVGAWLEGRGALPPGVAGVVGMEAQLRLQDQVAQWLKRVRHQHGALDLELAESKAVLADGVVAELRQEEHNRAHDLIQDFMICANGATTQFLTQRGSPSLRRVVRAPKRWDRIVLLAKALGTVLPPTAEPQALDAFLDARRRADPLRFPDLCLSVVKLLGAGEYVLELPGAPSLGHFGLAVKDYTHATAPNRRFPDVITQRLVKAALNGAPSPYTSEELTLLARHCTEQEDAANKVERRVFKSAAAQLFRGRIGEQFDALVTGAADKGTWVRLLHPPVEGKLTSGAAGVDVGDKLRVKLVSVNVGQGFIDFAKV